MTKYIKLGLLTLVGVMFSSVVYAEMINIWDPYEYLTHKSKQETTVKTCAARGYFNTLQSGMSCYKVTLMGGLKCFSCECDKRVYKYSTSNCNGTKTLDASSGYCKDPSGVTYYKGCKCLDSNAFYNEATKNCNCNSGYVLRDGVCVLDEVILPPPPVNCPEGIIADKDGDCTICLDVNKTFDGASCVCREGLVENEVGVCVSDPKTKCPPNSTYNSVSKECVCDSGYETDSEGNCVFVDDCSGYLTAQEGKICKERITAKGVSCFYDCKDASACGTGIVKEGDNAIYQYGTDTVIGVVQDGEYYKPRKITCGGNYTYANFIEDLNKYPNSVVVKRGSASTVSSIVGGDFWTSDTCKSGYHYAIDDKNVEQCISVGDPYSINCVVGMRKCDDTCGYKGTETSCDSDKYICEFEECSGKYIVKCKDTYFDKVGTPSCPVNMIAEKCPYSNSYACFTCAESDLYGTNGTKGRLYVKPHNNYAHSNYGGPSPIISIDVWVENLCGETVATMNYICDSDNEGRCNDKVIDSNKVIPRGKYKVKIGNHVSHIFSGDPWFGGYDSIKVNGVEYFGLGYNIDLYNDGMDVELMTSQTLIIEMVPRFYSIN